jgi:GNAT superfamily N-acetyltransferase
MVTVAGYHDFYREKLGSYADELRDIAARVEAARVLVAVDDGEVLGTVTYVGDEGSAFAQSQRSDEAGIRMLSVSPERQRRGVGRALSSACIELARREGKHAVVLHADEIMAASQQLYESLGFVRDPSRDFHPDGWTELWAYVLAL